MLTTNRKSTALVTGISVVSALLLLSALISTINALFTSGGVTSWVVLLLLTIAFSRLSVRVVSNDGVLRSRESIADSFVLLAVMLYAVPPSNSAGPAVALAALVGFFSNYRLAARREVVLKTGMACALHFCRRIFLWTTRRLVCWWRRTAYTRRATTKRLLSSTARPRRLAIRDEHDRDGVVSQFRRRQVHTRSHSGNHRLDAHHETRRCRVRCLILCSGSEPEPDLWCFRSTNLRPDLPALSLQRVAPARASNAPRPSNVATWKRWRSST